MQALVSQSLVADVDSQQSVASTSSTTGVDRLNKWTASDRVSKQGDSVPPQLQAQHTITERSYKRKSYAKPEYHFGLIAPSTKCTQRYLEYRWEERKLQTHVERIIRAQPRVDCKPPPLNPKYFFKEKKLRDVARLIKKRDLENKQLMEKLIAAASANRSSKVDCWNTQPGVFRTDYIPALRENRKRLKKDNIQLLEKLIAIPPTRASHRTHLLEEFDRHVMLQKHLRKFPELPTRKVQIKPRTTHHASWAPNSSTAGDKSSLLPPINRSAAANSL